MTKDEALNLALEALHGLYDGKAKTAKEAIKQALAQPEQDASADINKAFAKITPLPWFVGAGGRGIGLGGNRWNRTGGFVDVDCEGVEKFGGSHFDNLRFLCLLANSWPTLAALVQPKQEPVQPAKQSCNHEWVTREQGQPWLVCENCGADYSTFSPSTQPVQPEQEPVAFPSRRAVERAIESVENPKGMHLNDGKERVILPGGTLRYMLALIDHTSPPQREWVGLTEDEINIIYAEPQTMIGQYARAIEAKLRSKNV